MSQQRNDRAAFTLVELLAVMVVLGILAGMITVALAGVKESARAAKTRGIIASIDEVLRGKWEEYRVRPFSISVAKPSSFAPTESAEMRPVESARVRLQMVRDLMRMELPDRRSDVLTSPMFLSARVHPSGDTTRVTSGRVEWWNGAGNGPALYLSYNSRVSSTWTAEHESAECLYLILSTTFQNGISGLEMIPPGNIGDTDEDGMLEILDGWGQPLGFIRWPVGARTADDEGLGPDEFDPFRADFGYNNGDASVVTPFSLRPLVVSAGPDGEFDIRFRKSTDDADVSTNFAYRNQVWPRDKYPTSPVNEAVGRPNTYYFMDPYQRYDRIGPGEPFGEFIGVSGDANKAADNISNYNLATSS